jgi:hypothetical protein
MISMALRIAVFAIALSAAPLAAQQAKPLQLDLTNGWTHEQSGLVFPKEIGSMPFFSATQFAEGGWDVSLQYSPANQADAVSIYVYQAAVQDVGLLFAESRRSLENRKQVYSAVTPLAPTSAFTPPGQNSASGLRIAYDTQGTYKSTALAIVPMGRDWVVKFRLSSTTLSASELDTRLTDAVKMLGWPEDRKAHLEAIEAPSCTTSLGPFKKAKPVKADGGNALLNALFASALTGEASEDAEAEGVSTVRYCRDQNTSFPFGVYRPDNAVDRYTISLGDSGRAVFVEPDIASMLLDEGKSKKGPQYTVRMVVPGLVDTYPSHDRMPSPEQAVSIIENSPPASSVDRSGKNKTINIGDGALK